MMGSRKPLLKVLEDLGVEIVRTSHTKHVQLDCRGPNGETLRLQMSHSPRTAGRVVDNFRTYVEEDARGETVKGLVGLYLVLALGIAIVVTLLEWMGVLDAPLVRVWMFWAVPEFISFVITLLVRFNNYLDRRTYY